MDFPVVYNYTCIIVIMNEQTKLKVNAIVGLAEASVRDLITGAAAVNLYDEVVSLAELAKKINSLRFDVSQTPEFTQDRSPGLQALIAAPVHQKKTRRAKRSNSGTYPIYRTVGDKLLKVGWSKKNKAEYEHRAPKESMAVAFKDIQRLAASQRSFEVEALMPLIGQDDQEVPSYQIYMAIGWLIGIGEIRKCGRNDYAKNLENLRSFEDCWSVSQSEVTTDD